MLTLQNYGIAMPDGRFVSVGGNRDGVRRTFFYRCFNSLKCSYCIYVQVEVYDPKVEPAKFVLLSEKMTDPATEAYVPYPGRYYLGNDVKHMLGVPGAGTAKIVRP